MIPEHIDDIATGKVEGDALKEARSRRTTAERLERLEEKYDRLVHKVIESRTKIISNAISALAGLVAGYIAGGCL